MIAADSSTWISFLNGDDGDDTRLLDKALRDQQVLMPPAVLTELLSDSELPSETQEELANIPLIDIEPGYWSRAGIMRAKLLANRRKARLGDTLIAQSCIDRDIALLTRDHDFEAFAETAGLELVVPPRRDWRS